MQAAAAAGKFTVPLTDTDYDKLSPTNQQLLSAGLANFNCKSAQNEQDDREGASTWPAATPAPQHYAFLLGPVIVPGNQIDTATATSGNAPAGPVRVVGRLSLKGSGQAAWANYTKAHNINNAAN